MTNSTILCNRTPWTNKAWRRQAQSLQANTGLTLKGAMRRIALAYVAVIPNWHGDWSKAMQLFEGRASI